jgi:ribokinase
MEPNFDFIAIGDTTTDAFIRIKHASVHYDKKDDEEKICMTNGSKIPYESLDLIPAVGNSPNAAVSAARLGLNSALITDFGDDQFGQNCLKRLEEEKVASDFIKVHKGKKSNYHFVLWHKAERTILIKHEEYEYSLPNINSPKWIYFSSVGENSLSYHQEIADYLKSHPEIKLAFQPGTFQIKLGAEKLKDLYSATEVFFCNKEEAQLILDMHGMDDIPTLAREISNLGPKISVITDGPKGAYAFDGTDVWFMPPYPDPAPPFERTGAGDSFASTFTSALALGKSVDEALSWGPINSMSVVQKIGAQAGLLSRKELEKYLADAPEDYVPKKV